MTDIYFPNVGNALLAGTRARLETEQLDQMRRRRDMAPDVQAAIGGDNAALGRVAAVDPDYALKIGPILERMDTQQRAKMQAGAQFTYQAANAILQANPQDRPAVYKQLLDQGRAQGFDLKHLPQEYTPQIDGMLRTYRQMAIPVLEQWKVEQDRPQPMPGGATGVPGGQAPAGWPGASPPATVPKEALPQGQQMVQYLVNQHGLSPTAAAGVVGSLYQEAGFSPTAVGDNGTAYGQGQWRNDRAVALGKFAQTQGKPPTDPQVQIDFLVNELKSGDPGAQQAFALLQQAKTPQDAATAMMHFFRPAGYTPQNPTAGHGYQQRVQYAQQFAPQDQGAGPTAQVAPTNDPRAAVHGIQLPPGSRLMGIKGVPVIKDGTAMVQMPDGSVDFVPLPQRKEQQPPSGYRPGPNGSLEAIPGGPADTKIRGQFNADTERFQKLTADMDRLQFEAKRLRNHPGLPMTTGVMSAVPGVGGSLTIPGTDAANFKAGLESLKSQISFAVLQAMRDASKTGGALGQVSDFENRMLQANLASLDRAQSEEEFKAALDKIVEYVDGAKDRLNAAYNMRRETAPTAGSRPNTSLTPSGRPPLESFQR